jgi:IS5 family transposase
VEGLAQLLETMVGRVRQVVKQTRIRIFAGETKSSGKIVSVFEPHTEIIRKGKASKPNEFGKLVKIQEAENQIVTHFEVFAERPADSTLLLPSIQVHQQRLGRIPRAVAADAGFYSRENEKAGQALGVQWMSVPNKKTHKWRTETSSASALVSYRDSGNRLSKQIRNAAGCATGGVKSVI